MYELPQTLLHLTGPHSPGAFCWEQTWRTPNSGSLYIYFCLCLEYEVLIQSCNWEQTIPFMIYLLPPNLPLPDISYCQALLHWDWLVTSFSCTYTGAELCTPFQTLLRPPRPCIIYNFSPPPLSLFCTNSHWTDRRFFFFFVRCIHIMSYR